MGPLIISPTVTHMATMIFLHGLGDTGHGWLMEMKELAHGLPSFKFILPTAPALKVTLNSGMEMPAWYDIYSLDENAREDFEGVSKSSKQLIKLIEEEVKTSGLRMDQIFIGGFSQGGAISLYTGLNLKERIGGVVSLSGYLPVRTSIDEIKKGKDIPYLLCHGTLDFVISYEWGKSSADWLRKNGLSVTWKSYERMQHDSCKEEMRDVLEFLKNKMRTKINDL